MEHISDGSDFINLSEESAEIFDFEGNITRSAIASVIVPKLKELVQQQDRTYRPDTKILSAASEQLRERYRIDHQVLPEAEGVGFVRIGSSGDRIFGLCFLGKTVNEGNPTQVTAREVIYGLESFDDPFYADFLVPPVALVVKNVGFDESVTLYDPTTSEAGLELG